MSVKFIRPSAVSDTGGFARASTATYVGADGLLKVAGINEPRYHHDPVTRAPLGLLLESEATNLFRYSAASTTTGWTLGPNLRQVGKCIAPDGSMNATRYTGNIVGNAFIGQLISLSADTIYTVSVYARLHSGVVPVNGALIVVDMDSDGNSSTYERVKKGFAGIDGVWKRFSLTFENRAALGSSSIYLCTDFGNGAEIDIWGAQLETGTQATSYIPTTNAPATRSADVVSGSGLVATNVPEADYPAWNAATAYALGQKVIRTTTHRIYERRVAGTTATAPELDKTNWLDIGPTNRWALFDQKVGTVTRQAESISVTLKPGRINSLAILGADASSVTVTLVAAGETVYTATLDLNSGNKVGNWYEYFYEPIYQQSEIVITDMLDASLMSIPAYGEGLLTVTLSRPGGSVACGALVAGTVFEIGQAEYGASVSIRDFSTKEADQWGNYSLRQGAYSQKMSVSVVVDAARSDEVARQMARARATPVVWIGAERFGCLVVYGFVTDWKLVEENFVHAKMSLEVEGLT